VILRVAVAGLVLYALASCTHRPQGRVPDSSAPAKAAFEVYPVEQIADVKDPHDYKGKALCQRCHYPDLRLTGDPNEICAACHKFHHGNHPVNVTTKIPVKELPLLAGGKVACHTCHDPHQGKNVLRMKFNDLCVVCHKGH
jgi:predicted CXXCH cytochrome family protein